MNESCLIFYGFESGVISLLARIFSQRQYAIYVRLKLYTLMAQGRSLWRQIIQNFLASLKPRKVWGELRGKDYLGTEYYEAPKSLQGNKRPSRWFSPPKGKDFEQEIPPEWEAWLRHRRNNPPTEEEIQMNLLKMKQTIENAKMLEKQNKNADKDEISVEHKFPVYEEYNLEPDKSQKKTQ